jgi:hypothetical protein
VIQINSAAAFGSAGGREGAEPGAGGTGAGPRGQDGPGAARASQSLGLRLFKLALALVWIAVAVAALRPGLAYYRLPLQERAYSEMHALYKPAGPVGHGLGIAGSLMLTVGVALYSLRKRVRAFARLGKLSYWLPFHIFLCTLGPFLVLLHTSFRVGGIVAIAFWSMTAVVVSGIFGRYVYARIPKTLSGQFVSLRSVQREKDGLVGELCRRSGLSAPELDAILALGRMAGPGGALGSLVMPLRYGLSEGARRRRVARALNRHNLPFAVRQATLALVRDELRLEQQIAMLQPFQKLFGYWHVFHLPLAVVMFLVLIVHVAVAVLFGYAWLL